MYQYASIPVYQRTNIPIYQCTDISVYQCTNIQIYQYPNTPVYQCTNIPIHQYTTLIFSQQCHSPPPLTRSIIILSLRVDQLKLTGQTQIHLSSVPVKVTLVL